MEILGVQEPFGGLSIIAVGDFFQLSPVKDDFVFVGLPGQRQQPKSLWMLFEGEWSAWFFPFSIAASNSSRHVIAA